MTPADLDRIEAKLKIVLPPQYRQQMQARAADLAEMGFVEESLAPVFGAADRVIAENLAERKRKSPTAAAYPRWWEEFVIIGTNGAGEYYALRLDTDKQVYLIGDEQGASAWKQFKSLKHFLDHLVGQRKNPPPLPSSFDSRRPLVERFEFVVWETQCTIESLPGDRPLTVEKLKQHGVKLTTILRAVRKLLAALAGCKPSAIQFADPPYELEEDGTLLILYEPPPMRDPRLSAASVRIFGGNVELQLELTDRSHPMPKIKQTPLDWEAVQEGIRGLMLTFLPPGVTMKFTQPKDDGWWEYKMRYTLKKPRPRDPTRE